MNSPLDPMNIDLGALLEQPGTTSISGQSIEVGVATEAGLQADAGIEISLDPTEGVSAVIEGGLAAGGGYEVAGGYDSLTAESDTVAGTTDVSLTAVDGVATGEAGIAAGGGLGINVGLGDSGLPELEVTGEAGLDAYSASDAYGSYDSLDIHQDSGLDTSFDIG